MTQRRIVLGELEAAVLNVLWERGPSTVQEVMDALPGRRARHYNTCSTVLARLAKRAIVKVDREGRAHLYRATVTREELGQQYLSLLRREVFGGSLERLVSALLGGARANDRQEKRLRTLLAEIEDAERDARRRSDA